MSLKERLVEMKKFFAGFIFATIFFCSQNFVFANPTCVLMKFTDDTRYDAIQSADKLSELVMKEMISSKKFNLKEFEPVAENIEARLYDEKVDELTKFDAAISTGNYNRLFEGDGFSEKKAQTISTAQVGQFVTPEITQEIGATHGAEYLIQGTIVNLGTGSWLNEDLEIISTAVSQFAQAASSQAANLLGSSLSFLGDVGIGGIGITVHGLGVQADVRIIKADTGEVVWNKRVLGVGEVTDFTVGFFTFTHSNFGTKLYDKAMNRAAKKIVDSMVADMGTNKLFVR